MFFICFHSFFDLRPWIYSFLYSQMYFDYFAYNLFIFFIRGHEFTHFFTPKYINHVFLIRGYEFTHFFYSQTILIVSKTLKTCFFDWRSWIYSRIYSSTILIVLKTLKTYFLWFALMNLLPFLLPNHFNCIKNIKNMFFNNFNVF